MQVSTATQSKAYSAHSIYFCLVAQLCQELGNLHYYSDFITGFKGVGFDRKTKMGNGTEVYFMIMCALVL